MDSRRPLHSDVVRLLLRNSTVELSIIQYRSTPEEVKEYVLFILRRWLSRRA